MTSSAKGLADYFSDCSGVCSLAKENGIGVVLVVSLQQELLLYAGWILPFDPLRMASCLRVLVSTAFRDADIDMDLTMSVVLRLLTCSSVWIRELQATLLRIQPSYKQVINDACRVLGYPAYSGVSTDDSRRSPTLTSKLFFGSRRSKRR